MDWDPTIIAIVQMGQTGFPSSQMLAGIVKHTHPPNTHIPI